MGQNGHIAVRHWNRPTTAARAQTHTLVRFCTGKTGRVSSVAVQRSALFECKHAGDVVGTQRSVRRAIQPAAHRVVERRRRALKQRLRGKVCRRNLGQLGGIAQRARQIRGQSAEAPAVNVLTPASQRASARQPSSIRHAGQDKKKRSAPATGFPRSLPHWTRPVWRQASMRTGPVR